MIESLWAIACQGKIRLLKQTEIPEGTTILVTLLPEDESQFWLQTSQVSLDTVWNNTEHNVYAQLLEKC